MTTQAPSSDAPPRNPIAAAFRTHRVPMLIGLSILGGFCLLLLLTVLSLIVPQASREPPPRKTEAENLAATAASRARLRWDGKIDPNDLKTEAQKKEDQERIARSNAEAARELLRKRNEPEHFTYLTMGKYLSVRTGMTLNEVETILGGGTEKSSSSLGGVRTEMYEFTERADSGPIVIHVMLQNGKVVSKSQFGLK